jgi:hypothetical protein
MKHSNDIAILGMLRINITTRPHVNDVVYSKFLSWNWKDDRDIIIPANTRFVIVNNSDHGFDNDIILRCVVKDYHEDVSRPVTLFRATSIKILRKAYYKVEDDKWYFKDKVKDIFK